MVAAGSKKSDDYIERLLGELTNIISTGEKQLKQVVIKSDAPKFHYSVSNKVYLEIKSGTELYVMTSKEPKEGKVYVFSPWHWNSGQIFLILEDYLEPLEPN